MIKKRDWIEWLQKLHRLPAHRLNRWQRYTRYAIELGRGCFGELNHDKAQQMAAALTYHTLFSMLPTLVLILVIFNSFKGLEHYAEPLKQMIVENLQPPAYEIHVPGPAPATSPVPDGAPAIDKPAPIEPAPTPPATIDPSQADKANSAQALLDFRKNLRESLQGKLSELQHINFRGVGIVGLLVFLYSSTKLVSSVERSFNSIFGLSTDRPVVTRFILYYTLLTIGPFLLIAGWKLREQFIEMLTSQAWTSWLAQPLIVLTPLITMWLLLFLCYSLLPNTRVNKKSAAIGALVSAIIWVMVASIFAFFATRLGTTTLYGALAMLPLFLLWIWLNWMVALFGLELTYSLMAMNGGRYRFKSQSMGQNTLVDPMWMVPLLCQVADRFRQGEVTDDNQLSLALSLPPHAVKRLTEALEKQVLLRRVEEPKTSGWTLARPAEEIPVQRILEIGQSLMTKPIDAHDNQQRAWKLVERLRKDDCRVAGDATIADLVSLPRQGEPANIQPHPLTP